MPVHHLVLLKLKPDTSPETTATIAGLLHSMTKCVPGLLEITFGPHTPSLSDADYSRGYTHGVYAKLATRGNLKEYAVDATHQQAIALLRSVWEGPPTVLDWEA